MNLLSLFQGIVMYYIICFDPGYVVICQFVSVLYVLILPEHIVTLNCPYFVLMSCVPLTYV